MTSGEATKYSNFRLKSTTLLGDEDSSDKHQTRWHNFKQIFIVIVGVEITNNALKCKSFCSASMRKVKLSKKMSEKFAYKQTVDVSTRRSSVVSFSLVKYPTLPRTLDRFHIKGVINTDMSTHESTGTSSSEVLPWLSCVERQSELTDVTPGEYVLRTLFAEFTNLTERKLEHVLLEPLEKPLSKSLQRGEDPQFDQLLRSLNAVAKYSLSSLLKTLFQWYSIQKEKRPNVDATDGQKNKNGSKNKGASPDSPKLATKVTGKEIDYLTERRDHAIDFLMCLVLIEVLKQLPEHPVDDSLTTQIENLAFTCFKQRSSFGDSPSATNAYIIAALYAEVIGVLAQTRFQSVRKRFLAEFKENAGNNEMLVNVICGMKYLRIKLFPVEHVEETFMFLQDCANVFIETRDKDKDVKYALAGVFVEILIPVAATAKRELHIPALKNFIDLLYPYAFDMSKKNKHLHAMYPLVAVLMCVSQKQFFLTHWPFLLNACLTNIKHRDAKLQRICLECLYRMLWVYVIRIKGENNPTTLSRLRSVTDTLFPRGSRVVNPRDVPITIFVKIVHFISHYNLDFAMQDIIFDLLCVGRFRQIYPERMNIGLRSFLVIVDSLQKKEGDPPMPNTTGTLPSGSSLRVKKSFLNKPLTEDSAKDLGISKYFHSVCKALDNILLNLDLQVGRPLMKNNPQFLNKDPYDMITGERKPKIDLFRTSVASIPKLIPQDMSKNDVVGLLSRLTIHVDEELKSLAFSSLQSLILDFVEWREDVIVGFVNFIMREVQDHHATLLDGLLRMILKMLAQWKTLITMPESERMGTFQQTDITIPMNAIHCIEGCGLAMLCSVRQIPRKLALLLLKEARVLGNLVAKDGSTVFVMDIIEDVSSDILTNTLKNLSPEDKSLFGSSANMDLQWFVDRLPSYFDKETGECGDAHHNDLWCSVLCQLLLKKYIPDACPVATQFSWQAVHHRLFTVYSFIDQSPSGMDSLTSLGSFSNSRSAKKVFNLSDIYLWQNYLMFACTVHPVAAIDHLSCETDNGNSSDEGKSEPRPSTPDRVESLFRFAVTLVRNESCVIRNAVVTCLGRVSPASYKEFVDELQVSLLQYVLEVQKRAENQRKRKKRDNTRTYLARIFELNAEHGCFRESPSVLSEEGGLSPIFVEYIENTRLYFCSGEADRDPSAVHQLKLNFTGFIYKMIKSFPHSTLFKGQLLTNELRRHLFSLLSSWCSKSGTSPPVEKMSLLPPDKRSELEIVAIQALCAVLCCGPIFDKCGLTNDGYFYKWIEYVLSSPDESINCIGEETVELLLDLNDDVPSLLEWVINKCYTGSKVISNKCFQALTTVMIRRPYPCEAISIISVVLFKTSSADPGEREKAAQLLHLLERRFLSYCVPGLSKYSQSPMELSERLANFHPELTIPLLAELTYRFETAPFVYQRIILRYMLPWFCNVQLTDITCNRTAANTRDSPEEESVANSVVESPFPHVEMTGDGWGSNKATQLILNNLFFLTIKYGEDFNAEFEELWSALSNAWIGNNNEILNYLNILAGIAAHSDFFPHAKRLVLYLVRANKEGTIQTLMNELQLTEPVAPQFERSDQPPYYTILYKDHSTSILAESDDSKEENRNELEIKKDLDVVGSKQVENLEQIPTNIAGSCKDVDEKSTSHEEDNNVNHSSTSDNLSWAKSWVSSVHSQRHYCASGLPLPVPHLGLRFAALVDVLPLPQIVTPLYRCNFSLILLSEVIRDQPRVNWLPHLPLILHVVFLGFDHSKSLIHEHCKSLLVNLAVILVLQGDYSSVAHALMKFQYFSQCAAELRYSAGITIPRDSTVLSLPEKEAPNDRDLSKSENQVGENNAKWTEKVKWLIWYLTQSEGKPLWSFEDITTKCHDIRSAAELTDFLVKVLDLFDSKFQGSDIRGCWARVASKWAISCSSRHYAGRSFQVLRGLAVEFSWTVLSDILSRLAESIGDNNEDVQGYVMEILLTLDSVVEHSSETHVKTKVVILSMEDEDDEDNDRPQLAATSSPERSFRNLSNKSSGGHIRSLSSGCDLRGRFSQFEELSPKMRSVSLQSLRLTNEDTTTLSQTDLLSRIFWVAVSLLESDYEHEFVMAVKLLSKVLKLIDLSHKSTVDRLESLLYKLKWSQFSGVQMLLLKGLTSAATSSPTIELIKNTTPYSNISLMDVSEYSGVALSILALLPYMIQRFNEPDDFCLSCAAIVGQVCVNNNMLGFGKLFVMYNQRTYHKTVQMWTEAVCRYIYEFYRQSIRTLLAFLTELLERGPQINQTAILNITCALMRHIDFKLSSTRHVLIPTLKVISKHIKDDLWKESLNVLKLAVSSCSQLEVPVQRLSSVMFDSTWSLDQTAVSRQELPGKTLDFTFDVSTTLCSPQEGQDVPQKGLSEPSGWKRPQLSQRRTKERLVSVLHVCGYHIGLKQSPSVVFSSSSDLMVEKQAGSDHSSSDENQYVEGENKEGEQANEAQQLIGVFTGFDFLDDEIDEHDDDISGFGWDLPSGEYTTPEPGDSRLRHSPLSGSEPDIIASYRMDTSDEEDEITRSLSSTVSPSIAMPLTEEALRAHDQSKGFLPSSHYTPLSESSQESGEFLSSPGLQRFVTSLLDIHNIDDQWRSHVTALINDSSGFASVNTFALLALLLRQIRRRVNEITRQCCNVLDNSLFGVTSLFVEILEVLDEQGHCPHVYMDSETVRRSNILERQKFMVLEIDDHYRSYKEMLLNAGRALERLRSVAKPQGEYPPSQDRDTLSAEESSYEDCEITLCWALYKLHFQVLLFLDSYSRLFEHLQKQASKADIVDLTNKVGLVRNEITSALVSVKHASVELSMEQMADTNTHTYGSVIESIMRNLHTNNTEFAIRTLYVFRDKLHKDGGQDDVEFLAKLYGRYLVEKKPGAIAMSNPEFTLPAVITKLKQMTINVLSVIEQLSPADKT